MTIKEAKRLALQLAALSSDERETVLAMADLAAGAREPKPKPKRSYVRRQLDKVAREMPGAIVESMRKGLAEPTGKPKRARKPRAVAEPEVGAEA